MRKLEWRELSVVRGWPDTIATFREWRRSPARVLLWLLVGLAIALLLLGLVWVVGAYSPVSPERPHRLPNRPFPDQAAHMLALYRNNIVVLALHAVACFAGYVIYLGMTDDEEGWVGDTTRALAVFALLFVPVATLLSIGTQAWVLGSYAATASGWLHVSVGQLLATTLPHSLVELTAVFLPLAAWLVIRVQGRPQQLLAATILSTFIALPMLAWAAYVESYQWHDRVQALQARHPHVEGSYLGELRADPTDHFSASMMLVAGAPATKEPFATLAAAEAAAPDLSRALRSAVVIVQVPDGYVVHGVSARVLPGRCDDVPAGARVDERPFRLAEVRDARLDPRGMVAIAAAGPKPLEFVDGDERRLVAALVADAPPDRFGDCDE